MPRTLFIDQRNWAGENNLMAKNGLTITIICLNEEKNLPRVLASTSFADEVLVIDDHSHDQSAQIARKFGAKVIQHKFEGYGQQKNFAANQAQNNWILSIDADEEISPELRDAVLAVIHSEDANAVYSVDRRTYFLGKFIRFGGWYPDQVARLYNRTRARFTEPKVHEILVPSDGSPVNLLKGPLNHYSFPTVASQLERNIKYANLGAQELVARKGNPSLFAVFIRPAWKIFECLILKAGILDGVAGIVIALNAGHSMFMKYSIAYFDLTKTRNKIGE